MPRINKGFFSLHLWLILSVALGFSPFSHAQTRGAPIHPLKKARALKKKPVAPPPPAAERELDRKDFGQGQYKIEEDAIREKIISKTGTPYAPSIARKDLDALAKTGFFYDVQVDLEEGPE